VFNHETKEQGVIPFFKIGTFGKEPDAYITEELYNNYKQKFSFPKKGNILRSAAGTIGRTLIYDGQPSYYQDSNIVWIDNNETLITDIFLYHILQVAKYNTEGGTIQRLYNNILRSTKFICPTRAEQTAIATALNDADTLIQKLEQLLTKKKNIKTGALQNLLKPKEGWEMKKFDEVFIKINGKAFQLQTKEYLQSGNFPIIDQGQEKIVGYTDNLSKLFKCSKNGIIVFGDHTRILKFIDFNFAIGADGTQLLEVKEKYSTKFLFYFLLKNEVPNTGYNRHFKFLLEMGYNIPNLETQTRIAQILSDMDAEIEALEKRIAKYKSLKQGMMQELLTGRVRLVNSE
jgi:type I restriction enzyme S subunit